MKVEYMAHIMCLIKINFMKCKVYRDVGIDYFDIYSLYYTVRKSILHQMCIVYINSARRSTTAVYIVAFSHYLYLRCILSLCSAPYLVRYAIGNSVLSNDIYFTRLVGKCFPFPRLTDSVLFNLCCVYTKPERLFWTDIFVYI